MAAWQLRPFQGLLLAVIVVSSIAVWQTSISGQVPEALQGPLTAAWAVRSGQTVQFDGPPVLAVLLVPLAQGSEAVCLPAGLVMLIWCVVNGLMLGWCYRSAAPQEEPPHPQPLSPVGIRLPMLLLVPAIFSLGQGGLEVLSLWLAFQLDVSMEEGDAFPAGLWFAALLIVQPLALLLLLAVQPSKTMQLATFVGLLLGCIILPGMFFGLDETSRLNRHYLEVIQHQLLIWPTLGLLALALITALFSRDIRLQRLRVMALVMSTGEVVTLLNLAAWMGSWVKFTPAVAEVASEVDEQSLARAA